MLDYAINAMPGVVDDITQTIGNTPLIRLSKFAARHNVDATLLAKVEFFNLSLIHI